MKTQLPDGDTANNKSISMTAIWEIFYLHQKYSSANSFNTVICTTKNTSVCKLFIKNKMYRLHLDFYYSAFISTIQFSALFISNCTVLIISYTAVSCLSVVILTLTQNEITPFHCSAYL